jgi:hypothetical protein
MWNKTLSLGGPCSAGSLFAARGRRRTLTIICAALVILASIFPIASAPAVARSLPDQRSVVAQEAPIVSAQATAAVDWGVSLEGPLVINDSAPGAHSVMTADFDHDGDLDVVSAARDDGRIIWYRNNAGSPPTFEPILIGKVSGAYMAYPADLNRDGRADIVVAAVGVVDPSASEESAVLGTGAVVWFENNRQPMPGFTQRTIASGLNYPVSVRVADVDSDGDPDVLVASRDDHTVRWFEHNGAAAPEFSGRVISSNANGAVSVDAGDLDGDGDIDIASASENDDKIAWYLNDGNRQFSERIVRQAPAIAPEGIDFAKSVRITDVDRDGDNDIVYASENQNEVGWYESNGASQPQFSQHVIGGGRDHVKYVTTADMNNDGHLDVLSASSGDGTVAWYRNDGTLTPQFSSHLISTSARGARFVHTADLDNDGDLDVLIASRDDGRVVWYRNRTIHRNALYPVQAQRTVGKFESARHVRAADIDGDGDLDLVATGNRDLIWYEHDGAAPPSYQPHSITTSVSGGRWVDLNDMDRDGDIDILLASTKNFRIYWYENLGGADPQFTERVMGEGGTPRAVLAADLDMDGDLDAYSASHGDSTVTWYENDGARPPKFTKRIVATEVYYARSVYAADLDGDGDLDLISAAQNSDEVAWYENLRGQPLKFKKWLITKSADGVQHVHADDIDGDGDIDVLSASEFDRKIAWYENQGGAPPSFAERVIDTNAPGAHALYTADADGDGDKDLFAAVEYANAFFWYENNGQRPTVLTKHVIYDQAVAAHSTYAADLDGDGDLEALGTSRDDGRVHWFENLGGQYRLTTSAAYAATQSAAVPALTVDVQHGGRSGDQAIRLASLTLDFRDGAGNPLSTPDLVSRVRSVAVYRDACCDRVWSPNVDSLVLNFDLLSLASNGRLLLPLTLGNAPVDIELGAPATFFVVLQTDAACGESSLGFSVSVRATYQTATDSQSDVPLLAELMPNLNTDSLPEIEVSDWLHINEIAADNDSGMTDPEEPVEFPDWIELYNSGPFAIDLSGMYITDDLTAPTKYRIPDGVIIPARGFLLLIADSEEAQGPLHLNFSLSKAGESIGLFDTDAEGNRPIDVVSFGPQVTDITIGRSPDGEGDWLSLPASTPATLNVTAGLNERVFMPVILRGSGC